MQTKIHERFSGLPQVEEAEQILRTCVHCGFCNATCPTYLELGDERDGPRGRIYLLKQFLEEGEAGEKTQHHLDRCLSCKSCETTCPSGVQYGRLADIGRALIEQEVARRPHQRAFRRILLMLFPYPARIGPLLRLGQWFRPFLPAALKRQVPEAQAPLALPTPAHSRSMLMLGGCVQAVATPNTNLAAVRVFDRLGVSVIEVPSSGCCGAMSYHLSEHEEGLDFARRNIDAWWPAIEAGAEAVLVTASGCGAMVKDYGKLLADDPDYAERAARVSELAADPSELLSAEELGKLPVGEVAGDTAVHCPCSLQHAQGLPDSVPEVLARLGVSQSASREGHLCCGSAGTYSLLQPEMSQTLLRNKLDALQSAEPERIVTANVGCQLHLGSEAAVPVQHWLELVDELLEEGERAR